MGDSIRMTLTPESRRELQKLGRAKFMPELRKALYTSTSSAVPAVRTAVRQIPSKSPGRTRTSLRSQVAMAIKRRVTTNSKRNVSVAIVSEPHGGLANLARAVDGEIPWWHYTYGNEPKQDEQSYEFFYSTLNRKVVPGVDIAVGRVAINLKRRI